jgi:SAM-dependent methyltransferase
MFKDLRGAEFLQAWHERFAGGTARHFGPGRVAGSDVSSYNLLVEDVAALSKSSTVIDVACGDGYLVQLLSARLPEAEIAGIDVSSGELKLARERVYTGNVRFVEAAVETLPFPNRSVDAVTCHMAFMLFDDVRAAAREIARVLRPNGLFAAIFGPAPGTSPAIRRFGAKLNEIEREEGLPPLSIGDSATDTEKTAREIFENEAWRSVDLREIALRFDGAERTCEMLMGMYNLARLLPVRRDELEAHFRSELRASDDPSGCVLGLRHLVALRA